MSLWNRLKIFLLFIQLVRDPNRTDLIFRGVAIVAKNPGLPAIKAVEQCVLANETFKSMYDENYVPTAPSLEVLSKLPQESFGYALFQHMNSHGLSFEIFPKVKYTRPIQYLSTRLYQDHDLWHALLGYGVEVEEELAIQAFGVAQFQSPVGTMLIAGGLLHLLRKNPSRAVLALKKINEGYTLGKSSRFLPAIRLHELFAKPLREVRELCGVA
jgi:ubiquinone biosynthesis protein Coq4